jgi:hypothetical protein
MPVTLLFLAGAMLAVAATSGWTIVPSPNKTNSNYLYGVAANTSSDVWAVGSAYNSSFQTQLTLVERWNGSAWTIVPSPSPGTAKFCGFQSYAGNYLYGVAAISSSDAWAVGEICPYGSGRTLIEHWDGTKWEVVSSPNEAGQTTNTLVSVAALSANDIWAVGNYLLNDQYQWNTLTEHWDGSKWSIVASPNAARGQKSFLNAVVAISSTDVWAVGYSEDTQQVPYDVPLIEHYDGNSWRIVNSPYPAPSQYNSLYGVTALAADDIWAVGYENQNTLGQTGTALIEHWDGVKWSLAPTPVVGNPTTLYGMAALSPTDIWAVGYANNSQSQPFPISEHWNGKNWTLVNASAPGKFVELLSTTAVNGKVWAVGAYSKQVQGSFLLNPETLTLLR